MARFHKKYKYIFFIGKFKYLQSSRLNYQIVLFTVGKKAIKALAVLSFIIDDIMIFIFAHFRQFLYD